MQKMVPNVSRRLQIHLRSKITPGRTVGLMELIGPKVWFLNMGVLLPGFTAQLTV